MGDVRYEQFLQKVRQAGDRAAAIAALSDEQLVAALAGASTSGDPYLANVLASAAMNRIHRKTTIVDMAHDGMCELDEDGNVLTMNPAAERMLQWRQEELRGKRLHDAFHYLDRRRERVPAEGCPLVRVVTSGIPYQNDDDVFVRKDGTLLPISYTSAPVLRDGEVQGAVVVFRDISQRKERERLRAARAAAMEVLAPAPRVEEAAKRLVEVLGAGLGWQAAAFWMMAPGEPELRCTAFWSDPDIQVAHLEGATREVALAPDADVPGAVWKSLKMWSASDLSTIDAREFPRLAAARQDGLESVFALPCPVMKRPMAVLEFFSSHLRKPDQDFLDMLESLGSEIGQFLDRRHAEQMLRESVALKRGILDSALDAIVTIDHLGRVLDYNPAAERMFGYSADEVLGESLYESIVPVRYREAHRRGMARYVATGEGPVLGKLLELPAQRKDGTEIPTEIYIVRVEGSDPPIFTSHLRDITKRKQMEADLTASEQKYRRLFETDPDAILVSDPDRNILECNTAFTRLTGYTTADLRGRSTVVIHDDPREHARVGQRFETEREGAFLHTARLRKKNGEVFIANVKLFRVDDEQGEPLGYIGKVQPIDGPQGPTAPPDASAGG